MNFELFGLQKSNLVPFTGTLRTADIYTSTVSDRRGHKSQKTELIFYLNEFDKKFSLVENIGQDYYSKDYGTLLRNLNKADNITVWVRNSEKDDYEPKVFQIDRDELTILDFDTVKFKNRCATAFMLFMGLGSIVLFTWFRYPGKLKKVFE